MKCIFQNFVLILNSLLHAINVPEAIEAIINLQPNLLFLDIEIHDQTAFDILEVVPLENVQIVLVTAYSQYGLPAIKFSVVDYLLKPLKLTDVLQAVKKAKDKLDLIAKATHNNNSNEFIAIPYKDQITFLKFSEIVRFESKGGYTEIIGHNEKKFITSKALGEYEEQLDPYVFIRVHASHIVNKNCIDQYIRGSRGGSLMLTNGVSIPISLSRKKELNDKLGVKI